MRSKNTGVIAAIVAAVLLIGALVVGLWPVKTENETSCGSFLASNSSTYEEAFNMFTGLIDKAALETGTSERSVGLPSGAFETTSRNLALEEVDECESKRSTSGAIAGGFLLLGVLVGGVATWLLVQVRS